MYRVRRGDTPFESFFFKLPDTFLLVFGEDLRLHLISDAWLATLGYGDGAAPPENFLDLLHADDQPAGRERIAALGPDNPTLRFPARCRRRDGSCLGVVWNLSFDPERRLYYASAHETAVHLNSEDAHIPDGFVDGLTGLPNRRLFLDRLEHTLRRRERRKELMFAVLHCGIDRFKVVNHSLGHRMGDLLLMSVAGALRDAVRPTDMVARLAGDEFGILLEDIRDVSATLLVVNRIQQKLVMPFHLDGYEVFVTVSFGIVFCGDTQRTPDDVLRDANLSMVQAKAHGGGSYVLFEQQLHDQAVHRLELELDLRHAVERGEFEAYFQPIVALADRRLAGFEALARWRHPSKGLISPVEFIPVAEETGLIVPLGRWMLQEACRQARAWQQRFAGRPPLSVSVNLSARQLAHPELLDDIAAALAASGLPPTLLKLEITESAMMGNEGRAIEVLGRLREMGIRLLLDDFGTGYSSLSYLHRLPIDTLKVDRSFVTNLHANPTDRHFVETIVHLAHQLGLDIVCEGVEQAVQAEILAAMGVEFSQGFLYSRPVAAHEAEMLIITGL
ncbi:putative bifunctional diguanylate cyclase/phosphodiesterase [Azospira restricta]|uniref:GGDEF domain-containing protein n=1 Tax=Azospira restricta TaxID=404405 RepID=A0A974SPX3_9RHOO|nr:GGDEF domain-containing protein [Azospira restricta]QRJ64286.1 GGDEF domain-containing protein [Azospira restricta]